MPFRPEGTLNDWLRQHTGGSLPPTEVVQFIQQAASAYSTHTIIILISPGCQALQFSDAGQWGRASERGTGLLFNCRFWHRPADHSHLS